MKMRFGLEDGIPHFEEVEKNSTDLTTSKENFLRETPRSSNGNQNF